MKRGPDNDDEFGSSIVPLENIDDRETKKLEVTFLATLSKYGSSLDDVPKDVLFHIINNDLEVMLRLAMVNNKFAEWMRSDTIWKLKFQKDFPIDFEYCNRTLPIYVITKDHFLARFFRIDPRDKSGWKRFYLHVRKGYFDHCENNRTTQELESLSFLECYKSYDYTKSRRIACIYLYRMVFKLIYTGYYKFRINDTNQYSQGQIKSDLLKTITKKPELEWLKPYLETNNEEQNMKLFGSDDLEKFKVLTKDEEHSQHYEKIFSHLARLYHMPCVSAYSGWDPEGFLFLTNFEQTQIESLKNFLNTYSLIINVTPILEIIAQQSGYAVINDQETFRDIFKRFLSAPRRGTQNKLNIIFSCITCGLSTGQLYKCQDCGDPKQMWCGQECASGHKCLKKN